MHMVSYSRCAQGTVTVGYFSFRFLMKSIPKRTCDICWVSINGNKCHWNRKRSQNWVKKCYNTRLHVVVAFFFFFHRQITKKIHTLASAGTQAAQTLERKWRKPIYKSFGSWNQCTLIFNWWPAACWVACLQCAAAHHQPFASWKQKVSTLFPHEILRMHTHILDFYNSMKDIWGREGFTKQKFFVIIILLVILRYEHAASVWPSV